jgi:nucleoside-diphosphate-sugar epimerase
LQVAPSISKKSISPPISLGVALTSANNMATSGTVLIAGASGVIGQAAVSEFVERRWDVIAVSRRRPDLPSSPRWRHVPLDLTNAEACAEAVGSFSNITHVVYTAVHEMPGLVEGWRNEEQMATNLAMLANLLGPLSDRFRLAHVSLFQGTKAYGVHIRPFPVPARETSPRHPHRNFYWLQEDWVRAHLAPKDIAFTIFRPQVVCGDAVGVAMNIIPVLAAYGAICREEGRPLVYPGGPDYLLEAVDTRLIAKALIWATAASQAKNETFNITNGDVFSWPNVWHAIADTLGLAVGVGSPLRLGAWLPTKASIWDRIAEKYSLRVPSLTQYLGESHHYADFIMATGATRAPQPAIVSTIKLRQAGFGECVDTELMFRELLAQLVEERLAPPR